MEQNWPPETTARFLLLQAYSTDVAWETEVRALNVDPVSAPTKGARPWPRPGPANMATSCHPLKLPDDM